MQSSRSKKTLALWGCGGLLAVCVVLGVIGALIGDDGSDTTAAPVREQSARPTATAKPKAPSGTTIEYVVESGAAGSHASVTYMNETGGTQQENDSIMPWRKTITLKRGSAASLVAQSGSSAAAAKISCTILKDGKVWKQAHSSGPFAVVTCSGIVGLD